MILSCNEATMFHGLFYTFILTLDTLPNYYFSITDIPVWVVMILSTCSYFGNWIPEMKPLIQQAMGRAGATTF